MNLPSVLALLLKAVSPPAMVALVFRPKLQIEARTGTKEQGYYREAVAVTYPEPKTSLPASMTAEFLGTYAPSTGLSRGVISALVPPRYKSVHIRVFVYNRGRLLSAKQCRVFVNRVLLNGIPIEYPRSQLRWKGRNQIGEAFSPLEIGRGRERGFFVDVCAADEHVPQLQVKSLRETEGYAPLPSGGIYTFELEAEARLPCDSGFLSVDVSFKGSQWEQVEVVAVKKMPWWKRMWRV